MKRIGIVATQGAMLRALEVKTQVLLKEPDFEVQLETLQMEKGPTPRIELEDLKIELFNAAESLFERGYGVVGFADESVPSFFQELATECRARLVNPKSSEASAYASFLIDALDEGPVLKGFKVGMIGGLGPAATVDLYDKIVKATPAKTDQEHIKLVVEQNPQIPDRTAALLSGGVDPTLALYNCAKRLENDGCDALIIPCNTAHAFIPYMERHLKIPFINMQQAALDEIREKFGESARIGLMATTGTVKTGIYSKKAEEMGLPLFVPSDERQQDVMSAIYGPEGAKAGKTDGVCREQLMRAAEELVSKYDCNVLILGCTELPLILHEGDLPCAGKTAFVIDPTSALARKVVRVALQANQSRGVR
ncbi:MAG TPA: hypothetical protein DD376_02575 [Sutterella sp.]|nr:hypothetical protein [Sutterella sp.]